ELPEFRRSVGRSDRVRLKALGLMVQSMDRVVSHGRGSRSAPITLMQRALPLLRRQQYVHLPPHELFGHKAGPLVGKLQKVFFVASHASPEITVESVDPQEVARRMVFSLQYERMGFIDYYLKFRFAFPRARNELVEEAEEIQRKMLCRVLCGKESYAVYHPYPVALPSLYDAMHSLLP
ncbi:MAG: hypothetical protein M3220_20825, partial [Chloroflexota bacterium]|nr:hypothetical protein [Chloroflexota bacterium]